MGELVGRSEADLLDIRNFGAKSIDEVKAKLVGMGLALKDSPPGFDPSARSSTATATTSTTTPSFAEDEQLLTHRCPTDPLARGPVSNSRRTTPCLRPPRVPASAAARRTSG